MVVIRLSRAGRKNNPFYKIIVTDKRKKRDSFIEKIGYFDPIKKELFKINWQRYQHWKNQGAKESSNSRVTTLIKQWNKRNPNREMAENISTV